MRGGGVDGATGRPGRGARRNRGDAGRPASATAGGDERHRRLLRRCCCRTSRLEIRFRELGQLFSRYPSPPPLSAFPPFSRLSLSHSSSHISTVTFLCRVGRVAGSCGSRSRGANMCDPDGVAGRCQNVRWHLLHGFKRCTICDPRFWAQLTGMQHVTKDGYAEV